MIKKPNRSNCNSNMKMYTFDIVNYSKPFSFHVIWLSIKTKGKALGFTTTGSFTEIVDLIRMTHT